METDTLLVEIGTEELPPKSLNRLRLSLAGGMKRQLNNADLSYTTLQCHATPRRLALIIEGLVNQQPDRAIERRGPAVKVAYDEDGDPSKALVGFMRACGIEDVTDLDTQKTEKGEWLVYRASKPGASLADLLPELLQVALADLPIERRMRWGAARAEFVRPVKWLVSMYGNDELPISLFGLDSGRSSMGHRFMSEGVFDIGSADVYVETCRQHYVKVDFEERRKDIISGIEDIANEADAELDLDPELLDEVTALVEWPVALKGGFDKAFLAVPSEVLISAMKEHQRYFHLTRDGALLPVFITISNIESSDLSVIVSGNERVIRPRLSDAAFFYKQDTKSSLESNLDRLGSVVFQTELGTFGEKATRISGLASYIAAKLDTDTELARRAGLLAKADLVSDMVREFPDLQGVVGGYYALLDNESNEIAKGIAQHYRPNQSGASLPDGPIASSVALADKIDTLTGLFGIGQPPTGSRDPYALRRQSLGVIRICIENRLSLNIADCFSKSADLYNKGFSVDSVQSYVIERLNGYYNDLGISKDVIDAAAASQAINTNLLELNSIIEALHKFKSSDMAGKIIAANKRVANLLKKVDLDTLPVSFNTGIASDQAEHDLYSALEKLNLATSTTVNGKLESLAGLQVPIDTFFDEVLVMTDDASVTNNRLALLRDLRARFLELADFSLLQ